MPLEPEKIIGEILGKRAVRGFAPASAGYLCPFINDTCKKRSHKQDGPYPVCSVWQWAGRGAKAAPDRMVCICPKRFNEIDLLQLVLKHCWPYKTPSNPKIAREVTMRGFGNVDFVVADIVNESTVGNFVSVELQSIDITGSVFPAYMACIEGQLLDKRPTYGLNWDNVYKRYITQLIRKGYYHHHWGTKIIAFVQDVVYEDICSRAEFMRSENIFDKSINIIFAVCEYREVNGKIELALSKIRGTHHNQLQNAILYKTPPSKEQFCAHIVRSISD